MELEVKHFKLSLKRTERKKKNICNGRKESQDYKLLGCDNVSFGRLVPVFRRNLLCPSSGMSALIKQKDSFPQNCNRIVGRHKKLRTHCRLFSSVG
jgi:hypothetical protein